MYSHVSCELHASAHKESDVGFDSSLHIRSDVKIVLGTASLRSGLTGCGCEILSGEQCEGGGIPTVQSLTG